MGIDPSGEAKERIEEQDHAKGNHSGRSSCWSLARDVFVARLSFLFTVAFHQKLVFYGRFTDVGVSERAHKEQPVLRVSERAAEKERD